MCAIFGGHNALASPSVQSLGDVAVCPDVCLCVCVCVSAPNVEVTVTEKTTSVKKEKVTTVGDKELRIVENSPTFTETLPPVTEVNEGDQVR